MRLLNVHTRQLQEFFDDTPRYAILSHTWGKEEVTFQDINSNLSHRSMQGYYKIDKSCLEAKKNFLDYVWIDTCCIDKTSSAELSEAINSMFRWYKNSNVCFVFLEDVTSTGDDEKANPDYWDAFNCSRWFTRGWTLQELLAPNYLRFYDHSWRYMFGLHHTTSGALSMDRGPYIQPGTRCSDILNRIWKITSIRLSNWRSACMAERLSWASRRTTTRREDMAYSLLGILGVNKPLLYGEGVAAFSRLLKVLIQEYNGHDIFLGWYGVSSKDIPSADRALFPTTPAAYFGCTNGLRITATSGQRQSHFQLTNAGLLIELPVVKICDRMGYILAFLDCTTSAGQLALPLAPEAADGDTRHYRLLAGQGPVIVNEITLAPRMSKTLYIRTTDYGVPPSHVPPRSLGVVKGSVYPPRRCYKFYEGRLMLLIMPNSANIAITVRKTNASSLSTAMKAITGARNHHGFIAITPANSALEFLMAKVLNDADGEGQNLVPTQVGTYPRQWHRSIDYDRAWAEHKWDKKVRMPVSCDRLQDGNYCLVETEVHACDDKGVTLFTTHISSEHETVGVAYEFSWYDD